LIWEAEDPFLQAWRSQGSEAVSRLNEANPIQSNGSSIRTTSFGFSTTDTDGYTFAQDDFFTLSDPGFGSGFIYDAVISTGKRCDACDDRFPHVPKKDITGLL
jgi:hypothetical protein